MDKKFLLQRGLWLEYATLGWNVAGCGLMLAAAWAAKSVALAGFGIDSVIEIFASVIVIWQLKAINQAKEKFAERLIGLAFLLLALYILLQSGYTLLAAARPHPSPSGMLWLALTAVTMFLLAYEKGKIGQQIENPVLQQEAKVTVIDGFLAVSVLIGLGLNASFGWWWADPVASLLIVYYGIKEGVHALKA